jgi:teichuronic acid biosynthesis glycosyltransferase TuaC
MALGINIPTNIPAHQLACSPRKRLNVVFVCSGYPSIERPNYAIFIHRTVKVLSKYVNIRVIHLQSLKPGRPIIKRRYWDGVEVVNLAIPQIPTYKLEYLNGLLIAKLGYQYIKQYLQNADLIHSTSIFPIGFATNIWTRALKKAHVAQAIGRDVNVYLETLSLKEIQWLLSIDKISCNSRALQERLKNRLPNLENLKVIYRGVDTTLFTPDCTAIGPQINRPPIKYLYLGGFQTWDPKKYDPINYKGGHVLLDAWQKAEPELGLSSILIGGTGVDPARLKEWHSSLLKPENVILQSTIQPASVPGYIRASDVVVIPSISDGLPNLANESQACERPVLGTDAGGIPETVASEITGYIIKRNDPKALAQGLIWFYLNNTEIPTMGTAARKRVLDLFTWERFTIDMLELYQAAIDHHFFQGNY